MGNKIREIWSKVVSRLGVKRTVTLSTVILLVAVMGVALYFGQNKFKMQADVQTTVDNTITNQASLTYTGVSGQTTISSNIVQTQIQQGQLSTFTFSPGKWYLFALSGKPVDPDPVSVFSAFGGPDGIDGRLQRWATDVQGPLIYDQWSEIDQGQPIPGRPWGNLDTGMGFWVLTGGLTESKTISYLSTPEVSPKIISLEIPDVLGWALIGNPYDVTLDVNTDIKFRKGSEVRTYAEAVAADRPDLEPWVSCYGFKWLAEEGGLADFGPDACWPGTTTIESNHGGWIKILTNGLSMEITKPQ